MYDFSCIKINLTMITNDDVIFDDDNDDDDDDYEWQWRLWWWWT